MKASKRILITGASGLIGTNLTTLLQSRGHEVLHLSRGKGHKVKTFQWDVEKQTIEKGALEGVDAIVHLAGASVGDKRWTEKRKKEIIDSRVNSTRLLLNQLRAGEHNVQSFISASGVGYYGIKNPNTTFSETGQPGNDFLAMVTRLWENEAHKIDTLGIRVVMMRIGVVLAKEGGALNPISDTVKYYVGAPLGSGDQYISWIHIDDLCEMFIQAIEDEEMSGPVNAVAPHPVTNRELTKSIARILKKPLLLPAVPAFVLRIMLGEMADIALEGIRVSSKKIQDTGFQYKFEKLDDALRDVLKS
jgi:uncharacterized protein (TIGR01777 family)